MPLALFDLDCEIGDTLRIGDAVTLTIFQAQGKAVRIGVQAPADVGIMRKELVDDRMGVDLQRGDDGAATS